MACWEVCGRGSWLQPHFRDPQLTSTWYDSKTRFCRWPHSVKSNIFAGSTTPLDLWGGASGTKIFLTRILRMLKPFDLDEFRGAICLLQLTLFKLQSENTLWFCVPPYTKTSHPLADAASLLFIFRLDAWALSVIATATWLGGWLGVRHTPVLYQNR